MHEQLLLSTMRLMNHTAPRGKVSKAAFKQLMDDLIAALSLSLQCSTTSSRKWQLNWMVRRGRSSRVSSGDHKCLPPHSTTGLMIMGVGRY